MYRDWVHSKDIAHLSGGGSLQQRLEDKALAVIPAWNYNAPNGRFGQRFVYTLDVELKVVRQRRWNSERLIVFHTVILQRARRMTGSVANRWVINCRLDAWEAGAFRMLAEDKARTFTQYLFTSRGEDTAEHRAKIFHGLVLWVKLSSAIRWITDR